MRREPRRRRSRGERRWSLGELQSPITWFPCNLIVDRKKRQIARGWSLNNSIEYVVQVIIDSLLFENFVELNLLYMEI